MLLHSGTPTRLCLCTSLSQYGTGLFAPGIAYGDVGKYQCGYHVLQAHGQTVMRYRQMYNATQNGTIGITLNIDWGEPFNASDPAGTAAAAAIQRVVLVLGVHVKLVHCCLALHGKLLSADAL